MADETAQQIVTALEHRFNVAVMRGIALRGERAQLAYAVIVESSIAARERWRALEEELLQLTEQIWLLEASLCEARRRALLPDNWRDQYRAITRTEVNA